MSTYEACLAALILESVTTLAVKIHSEQRLSWSGAVNTAIVEISGVL